MRLPRPRILKRYFGLLLVVTIVCLLFFGSNSGNFILNRDLGFLKWKSPECLSLSKKIQISSNFTINNILDNMNLTFGHNLKATLDKTNFPFKDKSMPKRSIEAEPLHIIVIPHSHNDPGWLKTYDKYFEEDTTHILSLAVEKLTQYPNMTFIWVESCFLQTWWKTQTQDVRQKFKDLVKSGRIEIVSGSFVAPDEASPHYFALVDQMVEGHYWVKHNLEVVPETSLSFDQFGYSASIPYLMKQAGIKNILIKRTHRGVKQLLGENHWMTFKWRQFWDPQGHEDVLAQVDTYEWMSISDSCGPDRHICRGIDFSVMPDLPKPGTPEADKPFTLDRMSRTMAKNLDDFVRQLIRQFRLKSANYQQKVMLLPHGGDFHYSKAENWDRQHRNMKLFMNYINERESEFNIRIRFGTFKDYFEELERQKSIYDFKFPVINGDFFTYTEANDYWTGYYTTRQFDKRLGREVQESLRTAELFAAISFARYKNGIFIPENKRKQILQSLVLARQNLGIFQHHDAITGTARARVAKDYEERLSSAFSETQEALATVLEHILQDDKETMKYNSVLPTLLRRGFNQLTDRVPVPATASGTKVILVNSLLQRRKDTVYFMVETSDVILLDNKGSEVDFDIIPRTNDAAEIAFDVEFPPLSILIYTLKDKVHETKKRFVKRIPPESTESIVCENDQANITVSIDAASTSQICLKSKDECFRFEIDWRYYMGRGGAYTMISNGKQTPAYSAKPKVTIQKGRHLCRVDLDYDYFKATYTLDQAPSITGRSLRVDIHSDLTKYPNFNGDLAMRIITNIRNNGSFYTDSNGIQLMGRKFRKSLPFDGNVYPMTSIAMMEDSSQRVIIHSAQPHGVVSSTSGVLDFMIDRVGPRSEMGMPEGVMDNKPTKTILLIEFQTEDDNEIIKTQETALLNINSIFLNDMLQHPISKFYSIDDLQITKTSHSFLRQTVSCDIILANVKNLASDDLSPDGVSLTFHRRGISCPRNLTDQVCNVAENSLIKPSGFFKDTSPQSVHQMSLSHLMTQYSVPHGEEISLKPMDFKTFHFK